MYHYYFDTARRSRRVAFQSLRLFYRKMTKQFASFCLLFTADKSCWLNRRRLTCFTYMYILESEWALDKADLKRQKKKND